MFRLSLPEDADRARVIAALLERASAAGADVERGVREVIAEVRARGDQAVRAFTLKWEKRALDGLELSRGEWEREADKVAPHVRAALEHARARIADFHSRQRVLDEAYSVSLDGARLELRVAPLQRVGLYVPGGTARYPSSVLMTAVPAKVAGVGEIVMVTPGPSPETLYAAKIAGVDRVFAIGGAQAIAALAYGTESVPRVDKIVGPGNAYVAEAKRQVFGAVDIDAVAGPSEILIVADAGADARLVAADLLSQAEHDADAYAILVTPSAELAARVARAVERQVATLPRRAIAEQSLARHGVALVVGSLDEALAFANQYAPEHLELMVADPDAAAARVSTAGAVFLGAWTPEAAGDYLAGPNHVLPTGGAARYGSPLGVYDFVKRTSLLRYDEAALRAQAPDIVRLADVEGLHAHGRAVTARLTPPTENDE
ncbi:MAG TPA: histidinol dehydrogenase [Polyangia bacterium]|nr:histidinol dehydrogenase [Polyangia bacterium]